MMVGRYSDDDWRFDVGRFECKEYECQEVAIYDEQLSSQRCSGTGI